MSAFPHDSCYKLPFSAFTSNFLIKLKAKDGDFFVTDWLRNRNTMEFLGVWERIYNPNFNYGEFATIRNQAGLNAHPLGPMGRFACKERWYASGRTPRETQPDCYPADAGTGGEQRQESVEMSDKKMII